MTHFQPARSIPKFPAAAGRIAGLAGDQLGSSKLSVFAMSTEKAAKVCFAGINRLIRMKAVKKVSSKWKKTGS